MNEQAPPRYITRASMDRINRLLDLPYREEMQDWPIEVADPMRLHEFCDLYESGGLGNEEKFALMQLIVASLDDLPWEGTDGDEKTEERVDRLLCQDFVLHLHTVQYWCLQDETDPENVFAVTPLLRQIWRDCFRPEYQPWIVTDSH
jgi:hypothetical protein